MSISLGVKARANKLNSPDIDWRYRLSMLRDTPVTPYIRPPVSTD